MEGEDRHLASLSHLEVSSQVPPLEGTHHVLNSEGVLGIVDYFIFYLRLVYHLPFEYYNCLVDDGLSLDERFVLADGFDGEELYQGQDLVVFQVF